MVGARGRFYVLQGKVSPLFGSETARATVHSCRAAFTSLCVIKGSTLTYCERNVNWIVLLNYQRNEG